MTFRKIALKIHLWLGLITGLVVVILGITGAIYAFESEIHAATEPWQFVEATNSPALPPSELKASAMKVLPNVISVEYPGNGFSAVAMYYDAEQYKIAWLNPSTGEVLKVKDMNRDFFRIIIMGHFYLWLPPVVGQPIVAWSTLLFVVTLITGMMLWWPKRWNRSAVKGSFTISFKAKWKMLNYHLHNVLGFYAAGVALVIALTGMVWGLSWFGNALYAITSLGNKAPAYYPAPIDTTGIQTVIKGEDILWREAMKRASQTHESLEITFSNAATQPIGITYNPLKGTYYKREQYFYHPQTLQRINEPTLYSTSFANAKPADKLLRMNYDIHVGAIAGIWGKIMACLASLIVASLPITGFYIWWMKRR